MSTAGKVHECHDQSQTYDSTAQECNGYEQLTHSGIKGLKVAEDMTLFNPVIAHEQIPSKGFIIKIEAEVVGDIGQHTSLINQLLRKLPAVAVFTAIRFFNVVERVGGDVLMRDVEVVAVDADNILITFPESGGVFIKGEQLLDAVHKFFLFGAFHVCDVVLVGEGGQYLRPAEDCQWVRVSCG